MDDILDRMGCPGLAEGFQSPLGQGRDLCTIDESNQYFRGKTVTQCRPLVGLLKGT